MLSENGLTWIPVELLFYILKLEKAKKLIFQIFWGFGRKYCLMTSCKEKSTLEPISPTIWHNLYVKSMLRSLSFGIL